MIATALPTPGTRAARRVPAPTTPSLRLDLDVVAGAYDELSRALPDVGLRYAIRANPSEGVLETLASAGAGWDVTGLAGLDLVLGVDPDPGRVSYGGLVKKRAHVAEAHARGVRSFAVDCDGELAKVLAHAPGAEVVVRLAATRHGAGRAGAGFGCGEEVARRLLLGAVALGHPVGVSFHVGHQQRDVHAWDEPLAAVARLREAVRHRGADLATVDLGGGFPAGALVPTPPLGAYGSVITAAVRRFLGPRPPRVVATPGRCLVADAGVLEAEVVLVTERHGARWVHLDAALPAGPARRITAHRDGEPLSGPVGAVVLAGCASPVDHHRSLLPLDLRDGDRVLVHGAGA